MTKTPILLKYVGTGLPDGPYGKMMMRPPIQKMHHMKKFDKPQKFDREARKAQFYKNLEEAGFVRKVEAK